MRVYEGLGQRGTRQGPDMLRLVRLSDMQGIGIGIRLDCDSANAYRPRHADDPAGHLAVVAMRSDWIILFSV